MRADADDAPLTLGPGQRVHIVGIGGPGMSPIALVLAGIGLRVSGSDLRDTAVTERLRSIGIDVHIGHAVANVPADVDFVVATTAVGDDHLELQAARRLGRPVVRRSTLLPAMTATRRTIAVSGTHGKTTTTAMLSVILDVAGLRPSFLVGGEVTQLGTSARWDSGEWFVLEADESDGSGFAVPHEGAIVTNIEPDHLEHHGSVANLHAAFASFLASTTGPVLVCADDPVAARLGAEVGADTYGFGPGATTRLEDLVTMRTRSEFTIRRGTAAPERVVLPFAGAHNALNATAALAMAVRLGVDSGTAIAALSGFGGVGRRFEPRGAMAGVTFVDDYGHLPTEVAAVIDAARGGGWDRVVAVFQPHRYSRTQALGAEFADAFVGADLLVLTDVYAAGEPARPGIDGRLVVDAVRAAHPETELVYVAERSALADTVAGLVRDGDLCLTIGAGDVTALPDEVMERLGRSPRS